MSQDSNDQCQQVVFLSDALSPGSPPEQQTLFLNKILQHDAWSRRVVLQWIPRRPTSQQCQLQLAQEHHQGNHEATDSEGWWREQPVVLGRLRSGHNRLNAHMTRKFKQAPSSTCSYGQEDQATDHILHPDHILPFWEWCDKMCGRLLRHWQSNSMAVGRNWRRRHHSSPELGCVAAASANKNKWNMQLESKRHFLLSKRERERGRESEREREIYLITAVPITKKIIMGYYIYIHFTHTHTRTHAHADKIQV